MNADASHVSLKLPAATGLALPRIQLRGHRTRRLRRRHHRAHPGARAWDELRWLFARYGEQRVREWVRGHGFRLLSKRSFALWRLALDVPDYVAPDWAREAKEMEPW